MNFSISCSRNNFGDIPPWLDEGMASLYEVSEVSGNHILGLPNWARRRSETLLVYATIC